MGVCTPFSLSLSPSLPPPSPLTPLPAHHISPFMLYSGAGTKLHLDNMSPWEGSDMMTIAQIICIVILGATEVVGTKSNGISVWRFCLFLYCAFAAGLNVGTWVDNAAQESGLCRGEGWRALPDVDWFALLKGDTQPDSPCQKFTELMFQSMVYVAVTYVVFSVTALLSPRGIMKQFIPLVSCGMFIMSITYWSARIGWLSNSTFDTVYVQYGLALYCLKIMIDTQQIVEDARNGKRDVISHALRMLLNILHLFIRILKVVVKVAADNSRKKKRR